MNAVKFNDVGSALTALGRTINVELGETVGNAVNKAIPAIKDFTSGLKGEANSGKTSFGKIGQTVKAVGSIVGGVFDFIITHWDLIGPAIAGVIGSFVAFKTVLLGFNIAMLLTNPIGIAIVAIGALVSAGVWLYTNFDKVKGFLSNMWQNPIVRALAFLTPIGAIIGIGKFLKDHWQGIKTFFTTLWNNPSAAVDMFIGGIKNKFAGAFDWLKGTWGKVKAIFNGGAGMSAKDAAASRTTVKAGHAAGGIFNREHIARFAEGNKAEAVIPLESNRSQGLSIWKKAGQILGVNNGGGLVVSVDASINISGNAEKGMLGDLQTAMNAQKRDLETMINQILDKRERQRLRTRMV